MGGHSRENRMSFKSAVTTFGLLLTCICVMPRCGRSADVTVDIEQAKSLYDDAQFTDAIAKLQGAIARIDQLPNAQVRQLRLAEAYFHLGLCYLAVDDVDTAKNAFMNTIKLDPGRRLDDGLFAPKVTAVFEQARLAVEAATPSATGVASRHRPSPAREVVFGAEFLSENAIYGPRQRPHPRLAFPGLQDPSFPIQRESYKPEMTRYGWRAALRLPNRLGRLAVAYRTAEGTMQANYLNGMRGFFGGDYTSRDFKFSGDNRTKVSVLDITWSGRHREWGPLTLRRELGYRSLRVDDSVKERLEEIVPDGSRTAEYEANATVRGHGIRAGIAADLVLGTIGKRWHLDVGVGYTLYVDGARRLNESVNQYTDVASDGRVRESVQGQRYPEFFYDLYVGEGEWDLMAKLRFDLGRGLSLSSGYQWSHGADAGGLYSGSDLSARGAVFALGYRLER
jgi:hypothetical protein